LVNGFDLISPGDDLKAARKNLLDQVDNLIEPDDDGPSTKDAKDAHESGELRGLWRKVREYQVNLKEGTCTQAEHDAAVEAFFAWQRKSDRLAVLKTSTDTQMQQLKHQLLEMLRAADVYVLERGAIEQYYPDTISGADKPSRAQDFCTKIATRDAILACCGEQECVRDGTLIKDKEFNLIFSNIFSGLSS
jgi:putative ATP-dependent endonuclease of OLD family